MELLGLPMSLTLQSSSLHAATLQASSVPIGPAWKSSTRQFMWWIADLTTLLRYSPSATVCGHEVAQDKTIRPDSGPASSPTASEHDRPKRFG